MAAVVSQRVLHLVRAQCGRKRKWVFLDEHDEKGKRDEKKGKRDSAGVSCSWDDAQGYYAFRVGEILDGQFVIECFKGQGVFSTVVCARALGGSERVAIKMIRNTSVTHRAGVKEVAILEKLVGADLDDKHHCVRLISRFEYRNHLCLVLESLHMNLRELLERFGSNVGINLKAVRAYAKQLFVALSYLKKCGILHCDIKLDNVMVDESKHILKLCDFGSAMFDGEKVSAPYIVSRWYRAPEILLGLPYDHALDMWSVGCCLYELYTGKVLFRGRNSNDMLRLHMEVKGPFPQKMLEKAVFADQHFDPDFMFCDVEQDPFTNRAIRRRMLIKPRGMAIRLGKVKEEARMLSNFKDLLEKVLTLDPRKRLTVSQALIHPFISC